MNKSIKKNDLIYGAYMLIQLSLIVVVSVLSKDVYYKIITACLGAIYNSLTAKGVRFGFCVGWGYAVLYGVVCFIEKLFATSLFMLFLLPMMIFSFVTWGKNRESKEVKVKMLGTKKWIFTILISIILLVALTFVLMLVKDSQPFVDALFFVISGVCAVLILLRYYEMWIMSALSGLMGCVMWLVAIIVGTPNYSLLLLNAFVLINSVFALFKWNKIRINQKKATLNNSTVLITKK